MRLYMLGECAGRMSLEGEPGNETWRVSLGMRLYMLGE